LNMFIEALAKEEKDIISLSLRPGVVETDMQRTLRDKGEGPMGNDHQKFKSLHEEGKVLAPELPARAFADAAEHASIALSGQLLAWDDERLKKN